MSRAEITRKFDEIVDFAGVEQFIDTPVKRYSSGMTVRLGFAVAAHLEPEILVVDEVLAVGDAEFQKKAIGKMQDISKGQGRTVLFVSHNMGAVHDLCRKAVLLSSGKMKEIGLAADIINMYLSENYKTEWIRNWEANDLAPGNHDIKLRQIYAIDKHKRIKQFSLTTDDIGIYFEYEVLKDIPYFTHGIILYTISGIQIFGSHDSNKYLPEKTIFRGRYSTVVWIPGNLLQQGDYLISFAGMRYNPFIVLFNEMDILRIQVIDTNNKSSKPQECNLDFPGIIRPKLSWEKRIKL
jgi:lipopolysaccharide transport system ATP-binding protein